MLPLSISNIEAIDPFKFNFCERNIAKTAAASVDAITAPISKPSNKEVLKTIEEKAIIMANSRKVYADEVYATLEANGICRSTFEARLCRGWQIERAMTEKIDTRHSCRKGRD